MVHGADIGWLSWLESEGFTWVDARGVPTDPLMLLKDFGVDSIRLRVMVDPDSSGTQGFSDQAHVVAMARRCAALGFLLMIDFHFSDTWADPAKQFVPAAWQNDSLDAMKVHLAHHVTSVLAALKAAAATPVWVQLGNEIPNGLLWGTNGVSGRVEGTTGWDSLTALINAGYAAVKAVDPAVQVIVHLDRGCDNKLYRWWFDSYQEAGGRWDVIGLSFYPFWPPEGTIAQLNQNLHDLAHRYARGVMVCEVGGKAEDPEGTRVLLSEVRSALASVSGGRGLGLFYWEPEAAPSVVGGYALGASLLADPKQLQFTEAMTGI